MADKFKKIDKDFLLTNSSLNSYGYRLLTSGYLIDEFKKNPIGYYMHKRDDGVLVKWTDLRLEGDNVYGKPCINLSNQRGQQTVDEIESGFLNAASFGHFVIKSISDNAADYVEGQTGPSVNKWFNRECSLVDIPGNYDSLTDLFDENDNPIKLSDLIAKQKINQMEKTFLTAEQLAKLNLKADAKQNDVDVAIADLIAKAAKVDDLQSELNAANTKVADKEKEINDLKAESIKKEVADILESGLEAKKITVQMKDILAAQYEGKPAELKQLMDAMKPFESVTKIQGYVDKTELQALMAKSGTELWKNGGLDRLKAIDKASFKIKYKEAFGDEPEE